jgi:hypothetical protein
MRPITSTAPPAANGITMVKGRSGQLCATAGAVAAASAAPAAQAATVAISDLVGDLIGDFMGRSRIAGSDPSGKRCRRPQPDMPWKRGAIHPQAQILQAS